MVAENVTNAVTNAVDAMKSQPLALALIIVNLMFLLGGLYAAKIFLDDVAKAETNRTALINTLAEKCLLQK